MTNQPDEADAPAVELTARVTAVGNRFVAAVDGLELEATGSTPAHAADGLVQTVRAWLEREDSRDGLPAALGLDPEDEATEIVLRFVAAAGDDGLADAPASATNDGR